MKDENEIVEMEAVEVSVSYKNKSGESKTRKGKITSNYNPKLDSCFAHINLGGGHLNISQPMLPKVIKALTSLTLEKPTEEKEDKVVDKNLTGANKQLQKQITDNKETLGTITQLLEQLVKKKK